MLKGMGKMGIACLVFDNPYWKDAEFLGVFQNSTVVQPFTTLGGTTGGVVAHPVAVVKVGSQLKEVKISEVRFTK